MLETVREIFWETEEGRRLQFKKLDIREVQLFKKNGLSQFFTPYQNTTDMTSHLHAAVLLPILNATIAALSLAAAALGIVVGSFYLLRGNTQVLALGVYALGLALHSAASVVLDPLVELTMFVTRMLSSVFYGIKSLFAASPSESYRQCAVSIEPEELRVGGRPRPERTHRSTPDESLSDRRNSPAI